ncbi:hypothetical protein [Neobacillus sp. LXY-4]|uniref:hypothetical protein n=1 Tax=Neobacillus sp. LXY-4 TaxID=3379826 RepID=UPI003EE27586
MITSLGILVGAIIYGVFQIWILLKKKMKKEIVVFIVLLIIGTLLNMTLYLGIKLPNPLDWVVKVIKPISDWLEKILKP